MFAAVAPSSPIAFAVLLFCFVLVLAFEFSNGFHDTANAAATVICTHSLKPVPAVLLSGTLDFLGQPPDETRRQRNHQVATNAS